MNQQSIKIRLNQAVSCLQQGQTKQAHGLLADLHRTLPINPDILFLLGAATSMLGDRVAAITLYDKLLKIAPEFVPALNAKGLDLAALGKLDEALEVFDTALRMAPQFIDAVLNKAALFNELGRYQETLALLRPHAGIAHPALQLNLGVAHFQMGEYTQAQHCAQTALQLNPQDSSALALLGAISLKQKKLSEALGYCEQAAVLNPHDASVRNNIAAILSEQGNFSAAAEAYEQALALDNAYPFARGSLLHARMKAVMWAGYDDLVEQVGKGIEAGRKESDPFSLLATDLGPEIQKRCAQLYAAARYPEVEPYTNWHAKGDGKIRVAYLSADFFNHATAFLMAELFELHDRERFEIIGICYGRSPDDEMRRRVSRSFDQFHEVANQSDREIAALIYDLGIDIAVDLKGHTTDTRLGILAYRPAPVQAHYLGYPGTTGVPFIDYLIADPVLIPSEHQQYYTEKIAYLPDCYQVNDSQRQISDRIFSRAELGLPETGFVFCSFNNNFKITPDLFAVWMRLLQRVEGSVLWLFQDNATAAENLKKEAIARGVDANRLVFAERMPLAEHLARHRCADLFLDTWYCNAHTTASDSLWAGLPIVTKAGDTFAGRVAASLLTAIGLQELITVTPQAYEALVYELATNPAKLKGLREKLVQNRRAAPLFDTPRFARNLERCYEGILSRNNN